MFHSNVLSCLRSATIHRLRPCSATMASHTSIPPAVTRLLSARYPTLDIAPSWLINCVERIRQRDANLRTGSADQLARAVRQELLDSDLAKVVPASYRRIDADLVSSLAGKAGDAGRGAILVQIESMIDIGYSAASQLEIAEARREARRANVDPNEASASVNSAPSTSNAEPDHTADFQAQEDDKMSATTVYPRRMLKLELSDGSQGANVTAIELQRIGALDMNTTGIGAKLLLKGTLIKDGYLLLAPQTVSVEGGRVREKDKVAESKLIDRLRLQLGKAPQSESSAESMQQTMASNAVEQASRRTAAATADRGFSPDDDESELLAALAAEEDFMAVKSSSRTRQEPAAAVATSSAATTAHPPVGQRGTLIVPENMAQSSSGKPRSQASNTAATKASVTQGDPISLIDSDEDELFASVPDALLDDMADVDEDFGRQHESRRRANPASTKTLNSREEPIIIESSPEP